MFDVASCRRLDGDTVLRVLFSLTWKEMAAYMYSVSVDNENDWCGSI